MSSFGVPDELELIYCHHQSGARSVMTSGCFPHRLQAVAIKRNCCIYYLTGQSYLKTT